MAANFSSKDLQRLIDSVSRLEQRIAKLEVKNITPSQEEVDPEVVLEPVVFKKKPSAFAAPAPAPALKAPTPKAPIPKAAQHEDVNAALLGINKQPVRAAESAHLLESLEQKIGGNLLTWIGGTTLAVAIAFLLPWVWEHLSPPEWVRVLTFHLAGIGFLLGARFVHKKKLPILARGLAGVGIFTLYGIAYVMDHHYHLWGEHSSLVTFFDCALITALSITIAIKYDSLVVICLGALGGYMTPWISSGFHNDIVPMFTYFLFLNVALLVTAALRNWSFLKLITFAVTMFMFFPWLTETGNRQVELMLGLHCLLFLASTIVPIAFFKQLSTEYDQATSVINSLWFAIGTWALFRDQPLQQLSIVACALAVMHGSIFLWLKSAAQTADRMPRLHLALALTFLTLAIPLQLENTYRFLAYAWAIEGLAFTVIGIYYMDRMMCRSGLIVLVLALARVFCFDFFSASTLYGFSNLDQRFVVTFFVGIMWMLTGGAYQLIQREWPEELHQKLMKQAMPLLIGLGNFVVLISLTRQWENRFVLFLWTLNAAICWFVGFKFRQAAIRYYAVVIGVAMVGARAIYHNIDVNTPFLILLNARFMNLFLMAVLYFVVVWAYRNIVGTDADLKLKDSSTSVSDDETWVEVLMLCLGSFVLIAAISFEIHNIFVSPSEGFTYSTKMGMQELASYSIFWTICGAALTLTGFVLRYKLLRIIGLVYLFIVLAKVFFVDLGNLTLMPRILALAVLGVILLGISFLYQKYAGSMEE